MATHDHFQVPVFRACLFVAVSSVFLVACGQTTEFQTSGSASAELSGRATAGDNKVDENPPAQLAESFTLTLPDDFRPMQPTRSMVEAPREVELVPLDQPLSASEFDVRSPGVIEIDPGPIREIETITGASSRPGNDGTRDFVIVEVQRASDLPGELLRGRFEGEDLSRASGRSILTRVAIANDSGDLEAHVLDGTNYAMILSSGVTEQEFEGLVESFRFEAGQ